MNEKPADFFGSENFTTTPPVIHEVKILLCELKKVCQKEDITLDQAIRLYECKVNEYLSYRLHDCSSTLNMIHEHLIGED